MSEYKYYIEGRQVYPRNTRDLSFKIVTESDSIIKRKKLEGEILLANDISEGLSDYDLLLPDSNGEIYIHRTRKLTDKLDFIITEDGEQVWHGEFKLIDCKFNAERQQVSFEPTVKDKYSTIFENKDIDINILNIPNRYNISINYYSTLEFYPKLTLDEPPTGSPGLYSLWKLFYYDGLVGEAHTLYETQQNGNGYYYIYAYEKVILPKDVEPFGDEWIEITSDDDNTTWGRPWDTDAHFDAAGVEIMELKDCHINQPMPEPSEGYKLVVRSTLWNSPTISIKNEYSFKHNLQSQDHTHCLKLKDVIKYVVDQVYAAVPRLEIKSTFLFNDPVGSDILIRITQGSNYITSVVPNPLNNLYLEDKSDFIKPDASQSAVTSNITFEQLMDDLRELFAGNLFWIIDTDGNFRIEHKKYFELLMGLDLTQSKYSKYVDHISNFSYKSDKIYSRETWKMNETGNADFIDNEISYGEVIAVNGTDENKLDHDVKYLYTDIEYMNEHLDEITNSGLVLICAEGEDDALTCKSNTGQKSGESIQNADISFANLLYDYGRHNRPIKNFTLNGTEYTALSRQRIKEQMEFEFTKLDDIDYSKLIQTSMGVGEIEEAEEGLNKRVKLKLIYEP